MKGEGFVEFYVDVWGGFARLAAFCWGFRVFSFDDVGDGCFEDVAFAVFGDFI